MIALIFFHAGKIASAGKKLDMNHELREVSCGWKVLSKAKNVR